MKSVTNAMCLIIIVLFSSCSNYFQNAFRANEAINDYKPNLIERSDDPIVYFTQNPELEALRMIENGYVNLGNSYFEREEFNDQKQVLKFASEIGARIVLLQSEFKRSQRVSDHIDMHPVSLIPVKKEDKVVYKPDFPSVSYSFSFNDKTKKLKETVTTSTVPNVYNQTHYENGAVVDQNVSTTTATNIWSVPIEKRNYYAVPNGEGAVIIPVVRHDEVEIYSYYASFWAKTKFQPALGVKVTDLDDELRSKSNFTYGVSVWAVMANSPASKASIYRGDIILSINNEKVTSSYQMGKLIRKNVGKKVLIELISNGHLKEKEVILNKTSY